MRAAGVPLDVEEDDSESAVRPANGVFIHQKGECLALDLSPSPTGYLLDVCIVPNLPWPMEMVSVKLEIPWEDALFQWLPDPLESDAKYGMYWLPTEGSLGYTR